MAIPYTASEKKKRAAKKANADAKKNGPGRIKKQVAKSKKWLSEHDSKTGKPLTGMRLKASQRKYQLSK